MAVTGSVAWRRPRWVLAPRRCFSPVVREARQPYGQGPRLLDRVRERIRTRHYSRRTEKAYIGGIRRYTTAKYWARTFPGSRGCCGRSSRDGFPFTVYLSTSEEDS